MFNKQKLKKIGLSIAGGLLLSILSVKPAIAQESKIAYTKYHSENSIPKTELFISNVDGLDQTMLYDSVTNESPSAIYHSGRVNFSPDAQYITLQNTANQQIVMDTTGKILFRFSGGNRSQQDFIWGPDSTIYYGKYVDGLYKFSMKDSTLEKILTTIGYTYDHNPAINPSNTKIAYVHHEYTSMISVNVMDLQTKIINNVANNSGTYYDEPLDLNWIDDNHLLFKIAAKDSIYYADINSKETKGYNVGKFTNIILSPDKKYIAIIGGVDLKTLEVAQLGEDSITVTNTEIKYPRTLAWSKDSEYFVLSLNKYISYLPDIKDSLNIFDNNLIKYKFTNMDNIGYTECVDWSNLNPGKLELATENTNSVKPHSASPKSRIYPNPVKDYMNIDLEFPKQTELNITLYDITGRIQYSANERVLGKHNKQIDMTSYPLGTYIMKLSDKNSLLKTEKIIKQ